MVGSRITHETHTKMGKTLEAITDIQAPWQGTILTTLRQLFQPVCLHHPCDPTTFLSYETLRKVCCCIKSNVAPVLLFEMKKKLFILHVGWLGWWLYKRCCSYEFTQTIETFKCFNHKPQKSHCALIMKRMHYKHGGLVCISGRARAGFSNIFKFPGFHLKFSHHHVRSAGNIISSIIQVSETNTCNKGWNWNELVETLQPQAGLALFVQLSNSHGYNQMTPPIFTLSYHWYLLSTHCLLICPLYASTCNLSPTDQLYCSYVCIHLFVNKFSIDIHSSSTQLQKADLSYTSNSFEEFNRILPIGHCFSVFHLLFLVNLGEIFLIFHQIMSNCIHTLTCIW